MFLRLFRRHSGLPPPPGLPTPEKLMELTSPELCYNPRVDPCLSGRITRTDGPATNLSSSQNQRGHAPRLRHVALRSLPALIVIEGGPLRVVNKKPHKETTPSPRIFLCETSSDLPRRPQSIDWRERDNPFSLGSEFSTKSTRPGPPLCRAPDATFLIGRRQKRPLESPAVFLFEAPTSARTSISHVKMGCGTPPRVCFAQPPSSTKGSGGLESSTERSLYERPHHRREFPLPDLVILRTIPAQRPRTGEGVLARLGRPTPAHSRQKKPSRGRVPPHRPRIHSEEVGPRWPNEPLLLSRATRRPDLLVTTTSGTSTSFLTKTHSGRAAPSSSTFLGPQENNRRQKEPNTSSPLGAGKYKRFSERVL